MSRVTYALGFAICPTIKEVILIKKNKPEFQKGFLNGIGGKVESGETPIQTMVREFEEECGLKTTIEDWKPVCIMDCNKNSIDKISNSWAVYVFTCFLPFERWRNWKTITDEQIVSLVLRSCNSENPNLLGNVPWLIGMSVDIFTNKAYYPPFISYTGLSLPIVL